MNNIKREAQKAFEQKKIEPDMELFSQIKEKILKAENEKSEFESQSFFRKPLFTLCVLVACLVVVILPCLIIPLFSTSEGYYSENQIERKSVSTEFVQEFIHNNFSKYEFVFDDCEANSFLGVFEKQENKLIGLELIFDKKDLPYTNLIVNLVIDKKYRFPDRDLYTSRATKIDGANYLLYKREEVVMYNTKMFALLEYSTYELYLDFDKKDDDFFNKFL